MPSDRNTVLTFALAALRLMPTRPTITRLVTVRRGSCVAEFFFVATFRYPRFESLRGPASSLRPANLFASCPAARLPIAFDTGGALGIWALRSFHPVRGSLGRNDPPSAASPGQGCFHLADPLAGFPWNLPRFIFVEGLAAQSFSPTFLKEADNRGHPSSASGFFPGTSRSHGRQSAAAGRCCLGHFSPSRSSDVNETRPHRLDPVRANGSRPPLPAPCRSWASRRCSQVRPARCDIAYDVPAIGGPSAS
jgi:hypothetical protein